MEAWLARSFNYGATLVNIFGWDVGSSNNPFKVASRNPDAIAAYQKFLRGETLQGFALDDVYGADQNSLPARVQALPHKVEEYVKNGGDPSKIEPIFREVEKYIKSGDLKALEKAVSEIEAIVQ
jgi:hypothetical protein